jgi:hypothetical protein
MPEDTTPHGGEAMHELPDRAKIPQPKPDARNEDRTRWPLPQNSEFEGDNAPPQSPREPERKP